MIRCYSGQRLRELRIAAGHSPESLALNIGRSVYSIHEYERGRVQPPVSVLARIAAVLGGTLDDFLIDAEVAHVA